MMKFSIITPSYNMSAWLKLCVASVADQEDAVFEHIVQDSCSEDGTRDWLEVDPRAKAYFENDSGMYDAINRGLRRATGDILAYLNCDEQYLPGTLVKIREYFQRNPEVDVVYGDVVMVGPMQDFLAYRKSVIPTKIVTRIHTLPVLTCATFFRRHILDEKNLFFDETKKAVSDKLWSLALVDAGCRLGLLKDYTSAFTATGNNLAFHENSMKEKAELIRQIPILYRACRPAMKIVHRVRKWRAGCYSQGPFDYSVYTSESLEARQTFHVDRPAFRFLKHTQTEAQGA
jgi:glycosyltransferase involved in cell wall biosynthesis